MRTRRQNIQLELALEPVAKGEARSPDTQGTEARTAHAEPERPATGQQPLMEAVVEPGNLKKALARVRRNQRNIEGVLRDAASIPLEGIVKLTGFRGTKPLYRVFRRGFTTDILGCFSL